MTSNDNPRRFTIIKGILPVFAAVFLSIPFFGAAADPSPTPSSSASAAAPPAAPLSAALFAGTTKAPTDAEWKNAAEVSGVRMGRDARGHKCVVKHVAEWVRIQCNGLSTGRADLSAGEKRDLTLFTVNEGNSLFGDNTVAQFSMRPGDRRVIQWIAPDLWWSVWEGDEGKMASGFQVTGALFGIVAQVDWASGPEPIISIH